MTMKLLLVLLLATLAAAGPIDDLKKKLLAKPGVSKDGTPDDSASKNGKLGLSNTLESVAKKLPTANLKPDFSKITDDIPDKLKKNFDNLLKKGIGRNEAELGGIRKKNKILKELQRTQWKNLHGDEMPESPVEAKDTTELLVGGDMLMQESQLDSIIEGVAQKLGVNETELAKLGVKLNKQRTRRQAIKQASAPVDGKWPKTSPIAYAFNSEITTSDRNIVRQAFAYYGNMTCLKFVEDGTKATRIQIGVYETTGNCWAQLGYSGASVHKLNFIDACPNNYGSVAHEIMHLFGVHHQQDRTDRNDYLINETSTILTDANSQNHSTPFDFGSVMQYFTGISKPLLYRATTGNGRGPTFADIALINRQYGCLCTSATVTCVNGGYPNPNGCNKCICPHGWGGTTCSTRDPGTENAGQTYTVTDSCQTLTTTLESTTDNPYFKKVWYHFKAPAGKKVQFVITKLNAVIHQGCSYNGVEMKLSQSKFDRTGYLVCGKNKDTFLTASYNSPQTFTSDTDLAMIQLYTRKDKLEVEIKFRAVNSASDTPPDACLPNVVCLDTDPDCQSFGESGFCDEYPEWMKANCPASCNVQSCVCQDTSTSCPQFKNSGYCDGTAYPQYKSFMQSTCPGTCGWCGTNAHNNVSNCNDLYPDQCPGWATEGYCTMDPTFMTENCSKSCNFCQA